MDGYFSNRQIRRSTMTSLLLALGMIVGCQPQSATSVKTVPAPDLQNVTLQMHDLAGKTVKLVDGAFKGDHLEVQVLKTAIADFNEDGLMDGAILAWEDSGGSGTFRVLCLLLNNGNTMVNTDKVYIGDRIKITDLVIDQGTLTVHYLDRAIEDAYAIEPYLKRVVQYRVQGEKLKKISYE
jgi:hypothetical protein